MLIHFQLDFGQWAGERTGENGAMSNCWCFCAKQLLWSVNSTLIESNLCLPRTCMMLGFGLLEPRFNKVKNIDAEKATPIRIALQPWIHTA